MNYKEDIQNCNSLEKLEDIRDLVANIDENIALILDNILATKEGNRAVVFSELTDLISL